MNTICTSCLLMALAAPPVETSPTPTTRLYVRTIPPGARVLLDGKELGTTDGLFLVPPGTGKLSISMEGQQPHIRQVEISEGQITRIEVTLPQQEQTPAAPTTGPELTVPGTAKVQAVASIIELTAGRADAPATPAEPPGEIEKALDSQSQA